MKACIAAAAALALALCAAVSPGWAASNRVWVSGHGIDQAGCGAPTTPCRSLQYSHDNAVAAGGEIDILDPAGYGAITITKAISIVNDGVGTAGVQATHGIAILIHAGDTDTIYLRGLEVDGVQFSGVVGIDVISAGSVTVANCVIRHFANDGVAVTPTTSSFALRMSDSDVANNNGAGIGIAAPSGGATARVVLDHVTVDGNAGDGLSIDLADASPGLVFLSNSLISNNGGNGASSSASAVFGGRVEIDQATIVGNLGDGLLAAPNSLVRVSRSELSGNGVYAIDNSAATATVESTGDNRVDGNGQGVSPSPLLVQPTK